MKIDTTPFIAVSVCSRLLNINCVEVLAMVERQSMAAMYTTDNNSFTTCTTIPKSSSCSSSALRHVYYCNLNLQRRPLSCKSYHVGDDSVLLVEPLVFDTGNTHMAASNFPVLSVLHFHGRPMLLDTGTVSPPTCRS